MSTARQSRFERPRFQPDDLLGPSEVCRYMGVSLRTIERRLPDIPWQRIGVQRRILFHDLLDYLKARSAA